MTARLSLVTTRPGPSISRSVNRPASTLPIQGTLALDWSPSAPPAPDLNCIPGAGNRLPMCDLTTDPAVAVVATPRCELPEPSRWTAQLVQAVIEVLGHERPRQQLVRLLSPSLYADISAAVLAGAQPKRPGQAPRARRSVSSVHVFEPADGIIEANAVIVGGARARAVALRLEGWDGRWRCTRLAIL
jgi:hypothetical protein